MPNDEPSPERGSRLLAPSRVRPGLSIRSILLIMLLLVSVASSVVVGAIGYLNGRDSLSAAAVERLVQIHLGKDSLYR